MNHAIAARLWMLAVVMFASAGAQAQEYPNRPIRFLVASASGSSQDVLARILGYRLTEQMGQQVVVDARSGASGSLGIELAKAAPADGYTIVLASTTPFAALPALKSNLPYDPEKDFYPLTRIASVANVLAVYAGLGVSNTADLVKLAKSRPGKLNYGSAGFGTSGHLAGAMFGMLAGIDIVHVPYKGAAQTLVDVMAGNMDIAISGPLVIMPHAKGGRIRVLATTGAQRDPLLPELPTVASVVPGYEVTQWFGVALPAGTPMPIANRLHAEIAKALQTSAVREQLAKQGATTQPESPAEFARFIKADRVRIGNLAKRTNLRLE
jgi:tripartite-type tricarboxylate transporter receptor subunit TctC